MSLNYNFLLFYSLFCCVASCTKKEPEIIINNPNYRGQRVKKDNEHPYKAVHVWPDFAMTLRIQNSLKIETNYIFENDIEPHYKINSSDLYDYKLIMDTASAFDFRGIILSEELKEKYDVFSHELGIVGKYTNPATKFSYLVVLGYWEACCDAIYLVDRKPNGEMVDWTDIWEAGGDGGDYFYNTLVKKNEAEYVYYDSSFYHEFTEPLDSIFLMGYSTHSVKFETSGRIRSKKLAEKSYHNTNKRILLRTQKRE